MLPSTWHECWLTEQMGHFIQFMPSSCWISCWQNFHSLNDRLKVVGLIVADCQNNQTQVLIQPNTPSQCKPFSANIIAKENYDKRWDNNITWLNKARTIQNSATKNQQYPSTHCRYIFKSSDERAFRCTRHSLLEGVPQPKKLLVKDITCFRRTPWPIPSLYNIPYCPRWSNVIAVSTVNCIFVKIKAT